MCVRVDSLFEGGCIVCVRVDVLCFLGWIQSGCEDGSSVCEGGYSEGGYSVCV